MKLLLPIFVFMFLFTACFEINSNDPVEIYKNWAGAKPSEDLELLNGQYWQSPHFPKEYIMYLKYKPTQEWLEKFLEQNQLIMDYCKWIKPQDAPNWFNPSENSTRYRGRANFDQGSRYFWNPQTAICYIYEIQL